MSANLELEKVLESVAHEAAWHGPEQVLPVLKARLLPILEAGQELRANIITGRYSTARATRNWDAALRAAMEPK